MNSNKELLLLMIMALAITIITANISFLELRLSHAQTLGNKDLSINATDAHDPIILLSEFNIYVIWVDFVTGNDDIYFKRSTDSGATFSKTINLSNNSGDSTDPDMTSSNDGDIYVVWRDDTAETEQILFQISNDNGDSFETELSEHLTLSNNTDKDIEAFEPRIVSDKANVYVLWSQGDFDRGLSDIFFRASTDRGSTFGDIINLSSNQGDSTNPDIASANDGRTYVVWTDNIKGKSKVFFSVGR